MLVRQMGEQLFEKLGMASSTQEEQRKPYRK